MKHPSILLLLLASFAHADDWPQWMGSKRDNVWRESGVMERFPEGGPKVLWRSKVAGGYAGPAVAGGRVYVMDYVTADNVKVDNFRRKEFTGTERVLCLDESTGQQIWKHEYNVKYTVSYPAGPRCTPTVHEGKVYTLGTEGHLICFDEKSGNQIWAKHLRDEYKTKAALWGYTHHPFIDGDKLICVAGGKGSHVVALDKNTGKEIWRSLTASEQGYSPMFITKAGGVRQLIVMSKEFAASINPESGEEYWSVPYQATSGSIIMTPVRFEDYLFIGGYSGKNLLLKLAADKPAAEVVWQDENKMGISPVNVQPFLDEGVLYGVHQNGKLMAVELPSGKRLWEDAPRKETGTAFIVKNGERYVFFNESGELVLGRMSKEGFEEIDRAKVIEPSNRASGKKVVWSMPAFANKHAYIRNDNELICVDLAKQ